jgi:hypothetical protein
VGTNYHKPEGLVDLMAYMNAKIMRKSYDAATFFNPRRMNEERWLNRSLFVSTVMSIPAVTAAHARQTRSIYKL